MSDLGLHHFPGPELLWMLYSRKTIQMDTKVKNRKETHGLPGLYSVRALQTGSLWVQCQGEVCGQLRDKRSPFSLQNLISSHSV